MREVAHTVSGLERNSPRQELFSGLAGESVAAVVPSGWQSEARTPTARFSAPGLHGKNCYFADSVVEGLCSNVVGQGSG